MVIVQLESDTNKPLRFWKRIDMPTSPVGILTLELNVGTCQIRGPVQGVGWSEPADSFLVYVSFESSETLLNEFSNDPEWTRSES